MLELDFYTNNTDDKMKCQVNIHRDIKSIEYPLSNAFSMCNIYNHFKNKIIEVGKMNLIKAENVKPEDIIRISSREVAEMMDIKEHSKILRKIENINETLNEAKIGLVDYWIEGLYKDAKGESRKEYLISKIGCELLAHKSTGEKGILFTVKYMEKFEEMRKELEEAKPKLPTTYKEALQELLLQVEENEKLESENLKLVEVIETQKPKVEYVDEILKCEDAILVTNIAHDYGLSAQALNKILEEEKIQRKVRNQFVLYAEYLGKAYTKTETNVYNGKARTQTLWTQKGRMLIHQTLKNRGISALMDI